MMRNFVQLGDVVSFSKDTTDFSEFDEGVFEYLEISGVLLGVNKYTTSIVEVSDAPSRAKMKTQKGDIVISLTRPHRGAIAEIQSDNIIASTGFAVIRKINKRIDKTWLIDVLLSDVVRAQMLQRSSGGNYPAIIEDELKKIKIPLPEHEKDQKRNAETLQIRRTQYLQKLQQADKLLKSLNQYILESLNITIKEPKLKLCSATHRKDIKQAETLSVEYYHPERMTAINALHGNPSLKVKPLSLVVDFQRNIVNAAESPEKYLGLAGVESHTGELTDIVEEADGQAFTYQIGDVLYGRLRPYLNKVLYAERVGICSTEFHVMRVKNGTELLPEYLAEIMRSDLILSQTKHMMTGNTHPRISNNDVKNLCIPIPSISVQQRIINEIASKRNKARALREEAEIEWTTAKQEFEKELLGE